MRQEDRIMKGIIKVSAALLTAVILAGSVSEAAYARCGHHRQNVCDTEYAACYQDGVCTGRDAVTSTASASTEEIVWDTRATGRAVAGVPEDIIPAVPTGRAAIAENM